MTKHENWKGIDGWPGYEVSDLGNVRSINRSVSCKDGRVLKFKGVTLKQNKSGSGYYQVVLSMPGKTQNTSVHRLVAQSFIGHISDGLEVCHNDGDKTNNAATNLRIDTKLSNMADAKAHGATASGQRNARSKLTCDDVLEIRRLRQLGASSKEIGETYGVSEAHVNSIYRRQFWKHVI